MRNRFAEQLEELHTGLIAMGAMCESAIANAITALLERREEAARKAVEMEYDINKAQRDLENLCYRILMQQQPVARDLRQISSALKMLTDMERIGDQAADIAEITMMGYIKAGDDTFTIKEMSIAAIGMVTKSIDAYVRQDTELAQQVVTSDDKVDDLFNEAKRELASLLAADGDRAESVIDLLMIAKYLERIGDHAVNIAQWVMFAVNGEQGA